MAFNSNTSQKQAESTVAKLFASVLPDSKIPSNTSEKHQSSAQLLSNQFNQPIPKTKRKAHKSSKIKKQIEKETKFNRMIKYNIIKNHKDHSPEELKYLAKLRKKNINQIQNLSNIDDENISRELDELRSSLLTNSMIAKQEKKRIRGKVINDSSKHNKFQDFDSKVKKGLISYPGLTPGLAPVDYNESDSE